MTRARRSGGVSRHAGRAADAALTAASMSAALQNGTVRIPAPVAGLVIWPWRGLVARCVLPPIQSGILAAFGASTSLLMTISCSAPEEPAPSHHPASQSALELMIAQRREARPRRRAELGRERADPVTGSGSAAPRTDSRPCSPGR